MNTVYVSNTFSLCFLICEITKFNTIYLPQCALMEIKSDYMYECAEISHNYSIIFIYPRLMCMKEKLMLFIQCV